MQLLSLLLASSLAMQGASIPTQWQLQEDYPFNVLSSFSSVPPKSSNLAQLLSTAKEFLPAVDKVYVEMHQFPELSGQEWGTQKRIVSFLEQLEGAPYEITQGFGMSSSVIAVLRNTGDQDPRSFPVVWLRADTDALPVLEKTGLSYASTVTGKNEQNESVPVMHACGHDAHVAALLGAAAALAKRRDLWCGTLVLVFQPAEETLQGAKALMNAGLFEKFPRPTVMLAQHAGPGPAGVVAINSGYVLGASDSVQIRLFGRGGHGAQPQAAIDPIVMGAAIVLRLQTIVSREVTPGDVAVVTVGQFIAGTKGNIIPSEATLVLTVRSFTESVRSLLLASIERIVKAEAVASNAPKMPEIIIKQGTFATYNDPTYTERVKQALVDALGPINVIKAPVTTGSEDFALYGGSPDRPGTRIPTVYWFFAVTDLKTLLLAGGDINKVPANHNEAFAPDKANALPAAVKGLSSAALALLNGDN